MAAAGDDIAGYKDIATGSGDVPIGAHGGRGGAAQVPPVAMPEIRSLLSLAVAAVVIAALYFAQDVLIPITLAVMLSFVLSPLVDLLQRARLWRAPAVILSVAAAIGVIGLVGTLIASQASSLTVNAPAYARTIESKMQGVRSFAIDKLGAVTREIGGRKAAAAITPGAASGRGGAAAVPPAPDAAATLADDGRRAVLVEVAQPQTSPFALARTILEPILGPLETTVIVLVVAIFVLLQKEDLRDRFIRLFGSTDLHRTTMAMDDAGQRLSRYFLSQLAVNTCFGIVVTLGLWAIGIPSPAMWGILAGLLRFVPYIGSMLAAVAPLALAAAIDPGWSLVIWTALLFVLLEPLVGYVVEPLLYGHSTGLSPVSVIVSAVFWTWIWGPIGLILSTPLTLCLVVLGRHVKSLEFFDVLLGDRPALTPVESFYQRVLANNPDEALAQAEALLADRPLIDYYDAVVLEGLKLAAEDQARGTVDADRVRRMTNTMLAVIDDLRDHVANDDPAIGIAGAGGAIGALPGAVACVAGRGPFDDTVSAMLLQLLAQNGVSARAVPHHAVSREAIGRADIADARVVLLSYLELSGSPAHLRYLIRRVRQRAPGAAVIVGLWPEGEAVLSSPDIQRAIGADRYVGTLREGVEAALAALDSTAQPAAAVA
ncbi:MAG: tqsA 2 [Sphingomonas bacterium]|nr:AI-2E family transporter [Sphingomonas bacterium]MDB5690507.1 tqsA 2 [Sphingomonas bacterium]